MKLKFNPSKKTYTLKGMTLQHVQALATLINNTVLDKTVYGKAAFELGAAFDESDAELFLLECTLDVNGISDPSINLSHIND